MATTFAFVAKWLRQPVILGYIAAGILIGETEGLRLVSTTEFEPISELGLLLLLFMIGLEIDLKKLGEAGRTLLTVGTAQFWICVALGLGFFPLIGFAFTGRSLAPVYLAVACSLSSTMIVVKLLYDKYELDTSAGRITIGILVFQDIWAILFLALQPDLRNPAPGVLVLSLAKGAAVVAFALLTSRFVLPALFRSIARVPELMVLGALAWCFGIALLAANLGLSIEMGALIAGVSLSTFPYNLDVIAKVISLRDFFVTLFFVTLGTKIPRPTAEIVGLAAATSGFLVLSRFLSIVPVLRARGLDNRLSVIPAINLSQISEFSLVICTLGVRLGHVDNRVLSVVVLTLVITAIASTYGLLYNYPIFLRLNPLLQRLGLRDPAARDPSGVIRVGSPVVFLGFARQASSLFEELVRKDPTIVRRITVIDFNPPVKAELDRRGVRAIYGDISHADTLHHANVPLARVIISTVPDSVLRGTTNLRLLRLVKGMAPHANVIATADTLEAARQLYEEGAAYVLVQRLTGAAELVPVVEAALDGGSVAPREHALAALAARHEVLP